MIAAAGLMLAACTGDDDVLAVVDQQPAATDDAEGFTATMGDQLELLPEENLDGQTVNTRSTMGSDAFGTWSTTDKISISDGTLIYSFQPKEETISGSACSFEPTTGKNTFLTDGTATGEGTFYAFYPADAVLGWNGATVTTMIYTEQNYSENVENSGVMGPYMAAVATTTNNGANASFTFGHVCSVIDVDLSSFNGGTVASVALCSNTKVSLTGRMSFNASTKAATVSTDDGDTYFSSTQSDVVLVSDINLSKPVVRFYVLPTKQTAGLTITVKTTDGNYYTKSSATAVGTSDVNTDYLASVSGTSGTACKPYYKKYNFGTVNNAKTNRWMAMIPGSTYFSMLSTPGSHDSATSSGDAGSLSAAKCQSETIAQQLENGVRAFDLRPQYCSSSTISADNLTIYHGPYSTGILYKDAIATIVDFLQKNPTEAISIIMMKESATGTDQTSTMVSVINSIHSSYSNYFKVLDHSYYTLNDYRGKIFYGCRPAQDITGAVRVTNWPDDTSATGYSVGVGGLCYASVEDAYNTKDDAKKTVVNVLLDLASANTNRARFHYTFTSVAWSLLGPTITGQANTQNPAAATYIGTLTGPTGYVYGDFMGSSSYSGSTLLKAIIAQNAKYVYKNRTRCSTATAGEDTGTSLHSDEFADDSQVYSRRR